MQRNSTVALIVGLDLSSVVGVCLGCGWDRCSCGSGPAVIVLTLQAQYKTEVGGLEPGDTACSRVEVPGGQ